MTKKILLGLGATTALVGTSFAIVSCANDSTPEKTEATITYNKEAFIASKSIPGVSSDQTKYLEEIVKEENQEKLNAIFTSSEEGAIASIKVTATGANVTFTLTAVEGFTLDKDTFEIVFADGTVAATVAYNPDKFDDSKSISGVSSQTTYIDEIGKEANKDKLNAIFTSSEEGAIASIKVTATGANVIFSLTATDGFTLDKNTFEIVYADGTLVDDSTPDEIK